MFEKDPHRAQPAKMDVMADADVCSAVVSENSVGEMHLQNVPTSNGVQWIAVDKRLWTSGGGVTSKSLDLMKYGPAFG